MMVNPLLLLKLMMMGSRYHLYTILVLVACASPCETMPRRPTRATVLRPARAPRWRFTKQPGTRRNLRHLLNKHYVLNRQLAVVNFTCAASARHAR